MKLSVLVLTLFFIQLNYCESKTISWLPNVFDVFSNTTNQLTNYVKEKGRNIKNFYIENVRPKVKSFLGQDKNTTKVYQNNYVSDNKPLRIKRKFYNHSAQGQETDVNIHDVIAHQEIKQKYTDDDPTVEMTTPQLIALHGYVAESHTIVTEDGYILTVHRIPFPKNASERNLRKTVLLHHGLLGSSADWVMSGPEKGLAYILSEAGYDVWMANVRGNTYSRAHVSRNTNSFAFWNFTFHEVSQHDLPAVIDYIMETKGWDVKINYVGHSMGTTVLFALLSTKTQYNKILRAGFALAPVAFMTDVKSPIHLFARFSNNLEYLMKLLGANEFLPQNAILRWLSKYTCEINHYEEVFCENSLFVLCGYDPKQFNKSLLPVVLAHTPAGASTKTLIHYAQEIYQQGKFQQFDYGPDGNIKQYGTITPPEYSLHKITLPIALLSSQNDWFASDMDVTNLYVQLANPIEHYIVPFKEFNHVDFLWAIDAPKLVYKKLLQLMEEGVNIFNPNTVLDYDEVNVINI